MENWFVAAKKADFNRIAEKYHINPVTARLIRNRDIIGDEDIDYYLHGDLKDLHSPWKMKDMEKAVQIITDKIEKRSCIRVIGDYDIDGVNATYILLTSLKRIGAEVDIVIPDRMKDGYGINENLIRQAFDQGVDTIITCDNGISAIDQVAYAKTLGMTVIITDHHDIPFREREDGSHEILETGADAVVNPKQEQCSYPFKGLCGAAVAYKLAEALYETRRIPQEEVTELLEFVAIATVGDVMDLTGENRIFVKKGLLLLKKTKNYGLKALIDINGIDPERLSSYHIGFVLGPCINASGRLDTARRALSLLQAESRQEADELAGDLKALNDSRKAMTLRGTEQAENLIEQSSLLEDKVLVVYLPDCHESLAGIIAGRIREKFHRPVFILTKGVEGVKGSGRSIEAYHMFEEMSRCRTLFKKFGGHPMAAGLSMDEENIPLFRSYLNDHTSLTEEDFIPRVSIDIPMPVNYISEALINELELLEPFGKGNQKPVFAEKDLDVMSARILGKNKNVLKMQVLNPSGTIVDAMYFGDVLRFRTYVEGKFGARETEKLFMCRVNAVKLSFTYYPGINEYNGNKSLQIIVQNYR